MEKVKPLISKQDTIMRSAISAHDKLCTTRFQASGASEKDLTYSMRVSTASVSKFVPKCVRPSLMSYMKISSSSSTAQWQQLAAPFEIKWHLYTASLSEKWVHFSLPAYSHQIIFSDISEMHESLLSPGHCNVAQSHHNLGALLREPMVCFCKAHWMLLKATILKNWRENFCIKVSMQNIHFKGKKAQIFLPSLLPKQCWIVMSSFQDQPCRRWGGGKVNEIISCVVITQLPGKVSTLFVLIVVWLMNGIVDWWSDWWLFWLIDLCLKLLWLIHCWLIDLLMVDLSDW